MTNIAKGTSCCAVIWKPINLMFPNMKCLKWMHPASMLLCQFRSARKEHQVAVAIQWQLRV